MKGTRIDSNTKIGNYTYIGFNCVITKSEIGRYASIADNVTIGPGEHKINKISTSGLFYENGYKEVTEKDCTIGNDVWIGVDCIILRGVKIGNGAIIGANSVVTKDIPEFAISVGNPARVIKYRFNKKKIKVIKKSNWWNYDLEKAKKIQLKLQAELNKD
jgi:acetyltransferase-like isoleucine patch superfamily enzyme